MPTAESRDNRPPGVGARAIVMHRGHVLLLRGQEPARTYYFLPGGGVRHGETMQAACEREVLEETGISVRATRLLYVREFIAARHKRRTQGMPGTHHVVAGLFLCEVTGADAGREPAELGRFTPDRNAAGVTGMVWMKQSELAEAEIHPPQVKQALLADFPPPIDTGTQFWPEE
ncbi:MAG: NUDIX domain-containing protein [Planctomycetes bacterium]|nr:NUDIX domain-containing protein [Planctomycetota bacterium]